MKNLARRQPKQSLFNNGAGNGHSNVMSKDRGSPTSGSKRRNFMSFVAGALTTGAAVYMSGCGRADMLDSPAVNSQGSKSKEVTGQEATIRRTATKSMESAPKKSGELDLKQWKFYEGDVNQYYNELERDIKRNPKDMNNYAVHRWMGTDRSTKHHYEEMYESILRHTGLTRPSKVDSLQVLDAGCGLGASMMWFEEKQPTWRIMGRTLSEEQMKFVKEKLPYDKHNFEVELRSYDDLDDGAVYDVIYSIEAMIHSTDIHKTISAWAKHLHPNHGSLVIIDDFLVPGHDKSSTEMQAFIKGWMANSFYTVTELNDIGRQYGIELVESRDLLAEYRVVELNYRNTAPNLSPEGSRTHQGWIGSKVRQKLTVEGKIGYHMVVFRKIGAKKPEMDTLLREPTTKTTGNLLRSSNGEKEEFKDESVCSSVPLLAGGVSANFNEIRPKDECISSWYCCDQHEAYLKRLKTSRTHTHGFLKLDPSWFGNYMTAFAKHLNKFYENVPSDYKSGRFLDIGATGSTASGMQQVTSKFAHFAGPFEYWMLDSDKGAKSLNRTVYCDICDCPEAESCGFDVTFSHTVLEHAARPHEAFDTIARLTKKGGLTMHLVPWSYQYHATPDDYYRFSHSALKVLMEDRGFEPLEIGYDLCSKPEEKLKSVDEHYDFIWLTYVIAKKK